MVVDRMRDGVALGFLSPTIPRTLKFRWNRCSPPDKARSQSKEKKGAGEDDFHECLRLSRVGALLLP